MKEHLFIFGFETPSEYEHNAEHGTDDEDCEAVYIQAESEQAAVEWGAEIAEEFLRCLFKDPNVSWKKRTYAGFIDNHPTTKWTPEECARNLQHVNYGEMPDIAKMVNESWGNDRK